jgi:hypothetical protein
MAERIKKEEPKKMKEEAGKVLQVIFGTFQVHQNMTMIRRVS